MDLNLENDQYRKGFVTLKLIVKRIIGCFVLSLVNCHINQSIWTHKHSYDHPRRPQTSRVPKLKSTEETPILLSLYMVLYYVKAIVCYNCGCVLVLHHQFTAMSVWRWRELNTLLLKKTQANTQEQIQKKICINLTANTANTLNTTKWLNK